MKITMKAARVNIGLSQIELAKRLNVANTTICSWELGKTEPTASQLKAFAEVTQVSMDDIILPSES